MPRKQKSGNTGELFIEGGGQLRLIEKSVEQQTLDRGTVECLGMTFESEEKRRAYFIERLREKLSDPEFRKIEGFPIAQDEDILALSDPPYYTACPNPFLAELFPSTNQPDSGDPYKRTPLTRDIGASRDTAVYSAHTYHTKVPPAAITQFVDHFTKPGDVVLDGFCGSGMTGVGTAFAERGGRVMILCDLSPIATFISSVYAFPPDPPQFELYSAKLLTDADRLIGNLWSHDEGGRRITTDFQIWSEIFSCPHCQQTIESTQVVEAAEDMGTAKEFPCTHCGGLVSKAPTKQSGASRLQRVLHTRMDAALGQPIKVLPRAPVFEQADTASGGMRVQTSETWRRSLEALDYTSAYWFPSDPLIRGERYLLKDTLASYGITHLHHFYLPRQLKTFSCLWDLASKTPEHALRRALMFFLTSNALGLTVLNRFGPTHYSQVNKYFSGTLYVPSTIAETSHQYAYRNKRKRLTKAFAELQRRANRNTFISTQSASDLRQLPDASVDYVFVDPPFGKNLQYSELNQIWESWLKIKTNRDAEAVVDATRNRGVLEYANLMKAIFQEFARVLKADHWITIVFHNSANAVWMAIQEALLVSGFVVADVRTLDKKRETFKQIRQGVVKQDLIITAYKPSAGLEKQFELEAGTPQGVWDFVRAHLDKLPVYVQRGADCEVIAERQNYLLFDRMVAFHVKRGVGLPMSAAEFLEGLIARFPERDGMYFLNEQVARYDSQRMKASELIQLEIFIIDERSAIEWLRQKLRKKPMTLQEIHPEFTKEMGAWNKHEIPLELSEMLKENFILYEGKGEVPSQVHSYLSTNFKELRNLPKSDPILVTKARDRWYVPDPNKQADLEKVREKSLLAEFDGYKTSKERRLGVFRSEAIRVGFKSAYNAGDYKAIVAVAGKIPDTVIQEDETLLMYYDVASMRLGDE